MPTLLLPTHIMKRYFFSFQQYSHFIQILNIINIVCDVNKSRMRGFYCEKNSVYFFSGVKKEKNSSQKISHICYCMYYINIYYIKENLSFFLSEWKEKARREFNPTHHEIWTRVYKCLSRCFFTFHQLTILQCFKNFHTWFFFFYFV